jgi:hypothetical protein
VPTVNREATQLDDWESACKEYGDDVCEHLALYLGKGLPAGIAAFSILTETDTWGDEYGVVCEKCLPKPPNSWGKGYCGDPDCENSAEKAEEEVPIFYMRDMDEGEHGTVYRRCDPCKRGWVSLEKEELKKEQEYNERMEA